MLDNERSDQVLGVPTSEPLTTSPDLEVIAHRVARPTRWRATSSTTTSRLIVTGLGNSFEGNIVIQVQRSDGSDVVVESPPIAGTYGTTCSRSRSASA